MKEAPKDGAERQSRRANEHLDAVGGVDGIEEFYEDRDAWVISFGGTSA